MLKHIRAKALSYAIILICILTVPGVVMALDRPYVGVTFFYWYTWDYKKEWGGWIDGGVDNTPLFGYYNSPSYEDNYHSLWLASEWGVTNHFMDFWGQGWKAKDNKTPRETVVMKAAEQLQKEGYDIWMSFYQDGEKFNMKDFAQNISDPANNDVRFWLDNYAQSPAFPKWQGKPFWLVYGRNGSPAQSAENGGFRDYLKNKYRDIEELNKAWGSVFSSFEEISLSFTKGWNRAESVNYQYIVWKKQIDEMNKLVQDKYKLPGIIPSFDIAFEPFKDYGFSNYNKVLDGPHSYGGIFDRPESLDAQRFIHSAVSKLYGSIFWDTYKNFYCDWNTESRIPGFKFFPEPYHFDRFWVGNLMRYSESMVHLSWNEWWEGSNLEPCLEYGKKFCEKNLFYSTVIKECFDSMHNYAKGAKAAVLLNDWSWLYGSPSVADVYGAIQALRLFGINFELIPDDFVDAKKLDGFDLVVAPSNGVGFGPNKEGRQISKILADWVEQKPGRRLIVSSCPEFTKYLGITDGSEKVKGADKKPLDYLSKEKDKNIAWAILADKDQSKYLSIMASGEGNIGIVKKGGRFAKTITENPGSKDSKYMYFDVDNGFIRNADWPHIKMTIEYFDEGDAKISMFYDSCDQEFSAYPGYPPGTWKPADENIDLGDSGQWKSITYDIEDVRFSNNCNGGDFRFNIPGNVEFTVGKVTIEKIGEPEAMVLSSPDIFGSESGKPVSIAMPKHDTHNYGNGKAVSYYNSDLTARDVIYAKGKGEVLFVNDLAGIMEYKPYWEKLLSNWAKIEMPRTVYGDNVRGARLFSGATNILLAYNYDQLQIANCKLSLGIPLGQIVNFKEPVAEVVALRSDGNEYKPLAYEVKDGKVTFQDDIRYFGVYEVVFSPLAISHQPLVLHPGEKASVELALKNISDSVISGTLKLKATIPTLGSDVINYSLGPKEEKKMSLNIWAKDTVDWGHKTVMLEATWNNNSQRAVYWRPLFVERNPDLVVQTRVIDCQNPVLSIKNQEFKPMTSKEKGFSTNAVAKDVKVTIDGKTTSFGDIASNQSISKSLNLQSPEPSSPSVEQRVLQISFTQDSRQVTIRDTVSLMLYPKPKNTDKETKFFVSNSTDKEMTDRLFKTDLPKGLVTPFMLVNEKGESIPAQIVDQTLMFVSSSVPANACVEYTIRKGVKGNDNADMALQAQGLGTGKGTLAVTNRHYSITLSEEKGGTAVNFASISKAKDYANNSFGLNYGRFSQHDDLKPAQNTVEYINESKTRQSDSPGKIKVLVDGPVYKKAQVSWSDANIDATQVYEFFGSQKQFRITTDIKPKGAALNCEEIVAMDACFLRNTLYKIYPGGTGMSQTTNSFKKDVPDAGWRHADYIHPYSMMAGRGENISILVEEKSGINKYRQGFWTKDRPVTGQIVYTEVEYISLSKGEPRNQVHLSAWVMIHAGLHKQAKDFQSEWISPLAIAGK